MPRWSGRRSQQIVALVLAHYGRTCHLCGFDRADSADHIVLRRDGGTDDLHNLRPACLVCNLRRGTKDLTPELRADLRRRRALDIELEAAAGALSPRFARRRADLLRFGTAGKPRAASFLSPGTPGKNEDAE